jgi:hypothetical protein
VGGTQFPKHFGQSGQPIPLPEVRTTLPAIITKKINTSVIQFNRIKAFENIVVVWKPKLGIKQAPKDDQSHFISRRRAQRFIEQELIHTLDAAFIFAHGLGR